VRKLQRSRRWHENGTFTWIFSFLMAKTGKVMVQEDEGGFSSS